MLLDGDEPQPAVVEVADSPEEVRIAIPVDEREAGTAVRVHPRSIMDTNRVFAVGFGISLAESFQPLTFKVVADFFANLIPTPTFLDEFELLGLLTFNGFTVMFPTLGVVAIVFDHGKGLNVGVVSVERKLEHFSDFGISHGFLLSRIIGLKACLYTKKVAFTNGMY